MDLYSKPPKSILVTGITKWFQMPIEGNYTVPAAALSRETADKWSSAYTVLITVIFVAAGRLLGDLVLVLIPLRGNGNRHAMLAAYYNTNDPLTAVFTMGNYCRKMLFKVRRRKTGGYDWPTFFLALNLVVLVTMLFVGSTVAGILIPTNLFIGNVARVKPSAMFYPDLEPFGVGGSLSIVNSESYQTAESGKISSQRDAIRKTKSGQAYRALGTVAFSEDILRSKVHTGPANPISHSKDGKVHLKFEYSYSITGMEFGLTAALDLVHQVTGRCETKHNKYMGRHVNSETGKVEDRYQVDALGVVQTLGFQPNDEAVSPPSAYLAGDTNRVQIYSEQDEASFYIIPRTAGTPMKNHIHDDPWYNSEPTNNNKSSSGAPYVVSAGTPPIVCTQNTTWLYHGKRSNVRGVSALKLPLSPFIQFRLFATEFNSPVMFFLGRALGSSWFNSVTSAGFAPENSEYMIETANPSVFADLEHLAYASYAYSREVVRNTAMFRNSTAPPIKDVQTVYAKDSDLVIESIDITTLSVRTLLATPAVCLFLWLLVAIRGSCLVERYKMRSVALGAAQLYRFIDEAEADEEEGEGGQRRNKARWYGRRSHAPYIRLVDDPDDYPVHDLDVEKRPRVDSFVTPALQPITEPEEMEEGKTMGKNGWGRRGEEAKYQLVMARERTLTGQPMVGARTGWLDWKIWRKATPGFHWSEVCSDPPPPPPLPQGRVDDVE